MYVSLTKDHPTVKDSSLGPLVLEGIFFGNEYSSPLVRTYIPSLGRLVLANEVKFFPDALGVSIYYWCLVRPLELETRCTYLPPEAS